MLLFPPAKPLVERLGAEFFLSVPEHPGVYFMCGAKEGVLYVGKAKNLRRRLGNYRSANPEHLPRKIRRLLVSVERIYWDECNDEAAALDRERSLLLALRPRFNTVGVYPAPGRHLGWRHTQEGLLIGIGEATESWPQRFGAFTRVKPVYSALLRLVWRASKPSVSIHQMPSPLTGNSPPAIWLFPELAQKENSTFLGELDQRLATFLRGESPDLHESLSRFATVASNFEARWREFDALALREFHERLVKKTTRLNSTHPTPIS